MTQYKERLYNKEFSDSQRIQSLQPSDRYDTKLFLKLPANIPESYIVYGAENDDYKEIASKLFMKYIKRGTLHEINLECDTWRGLTALIESDQWNENEEYDDLLNL